MPFLQKNLSYLPLDPVYQVYLIGPKGLLERDRRIAALDDDEAVRAASLLGKEYVVELWDGIRFIARIEPGTGMSD